MAEHCEFIDGCPLYAQFKNQNSKKTFSILYCEGQHENCARKKIRLTGEKPPDDLLPTGKRLSESS